MTHPTPWTALPQDVLLKLFKVYETCWHLTATLDSEIPGCVLVSTEDSQLMDAVCEAFEPHETELRDLLNYPGNLATP